MAAHLLVQLYQYIEKRAYKILIDYKTEKENLYNYFSIEAGVKDAYTGVKEENKISVTYKMILGVLFVDKYEIIELVEMAEVD